METNLQFNKCEQDVAAKQKQAEEREAENIRYAIKKGKEWQKEHSKRARAYESELLKQSPQASADEKMLLNLASNDAALCEALSEVEVQLCKRAAMLVDSAKIVCALARALHEVTLCRSAAAKRVQELLESAGVLRGQRRIAQSPTLRRVS
jgi:hypothetical protein